MSRVHSWIITILLIISSGYLMAMPFRAPMDTQRLAHLETGMWRAYYEQDYVRLSYRLYQLFREEFNLSTMQTIKAAWYATQAAKAMRELPGTTSHESYQNKIIPSLSNFFSVIKEEVGGDWDPKIIAEAELEWWITRRSPEHNDIKKIGQQISRVYVLLGGIDNEYIQRAGFLRARAAYIRDQQKITSGKVEWKLIEHLLKFSYDNLQRGMFLKPKI
jgi:hypothetical protein